MHFSYKKNIIVIVIAAVLALVVSGAAIVIGVSSMPANRVSHYMGAAERYLSEMNYKQAIIEFQKILDIEPMNVDAYLGLANTYIAMGNTEKAVEVLNKGIDKTGDKQLKRRLEAIMSSSNSDSNWEETRSLTSLELSWLVEPTYEFDEVVPIRSGVYTDLSVSFPRNISEENFPSYSYTEDCYQVKIGDEYKIFYIPDRILSPFSYSTKSSLGFGTFGNSGIMVTTATMEQLSAFPWKDRVFGGGVGDGGSRGLFWDSYTNKGYIFSDWVGQLELEPAEANSLKSHHKVQKHDLSSLSGLLSTYHIEYTSDYGNGHYYDKFISPVYEPVSPKYALWSPEDKLLTDFIYDEMSATSFGITAACRDGKWGYLDENGKEITEFIYDAPWIVGNSYDYQTSIISPVYGTFPCTSDTMVVRLNGQYGLLYKDGRTLIDLGQFEALAPAWNNQLWAKQNGKWGLIDLGAAKQAFGIESNRSTDSGQPEFEPTGSVIILGEEYDIATTINLDLTFKEITNDILKQIAPQIKQLTNLERLYLYGNQISDISPLAEFAGLTNLSVINLYDNKINDISPLARLTSLTILNLERNQISKIAPLTELINLKSLSLGINQINDITPLSELKNLTDLYLYDNHISDSDKVWLKSQLPNCTIRY